MKSVNLCIVCSRYIIFPFINKRLCSNCLHIERKTFNNHKTNKKQIEKEGIWYYART